MKKSISISLIVALVIVVYSCRKNSDTGGSQVTKTVSLDLPTTVSKYYVSSTTKKSDSLNKIATLGRVLFYDSHLSVNNAISCGSCHKQEMGFADNTAFSVGYEGRLTGRNSLSIADLQSSGNLFWDGRETDVTNLVMRPVTNHVEMGIDNADVLTQKLAALSYYPQLFASAFGDNQVTIDRISKSIELFMEAITTGNSRFDQYSAGTTSALTTQEVNGRTLFDTKYNCGSCHNGFGGYGSSGNFKDIGLDETYTDKGRGALSGASADMGKFRVPNLQNVALTAPYMHDGRYQTLDEVIDHYSHNVRNSNNLDTLLKDNTGHARQMNISDNEKQDIIAFLKTLTDNKLISDPKFSNPFKVN
jgi:cytochrome c peroxidase